MTARGRSRWQSELRCLMVWDLRFRRTWWLVAVIGPLPWCLLTTLLDCAAPPVFLLGWMAPPLVALLTGARTTCDGQGTVVYLARLPVSRRMLWTVRCLLPLGVIGIGTLLAALLLLPVIFRPLMGSVLMGSFVMASASGAVLLFASGAFASVFLRSPLKAAAVGGAGALAVVLATRYVSVAAGGWDAAWLLSGGASVLALLEGVVLLALGGALYCLRT